jgi:hypothetical protein
MTRTVRILAFGVALSGLVAPAAPTRADTLDRSMKITFGQAVALPHVELKAGTYIFAMAEPSSNNGVVKVTSADGGTCYVLAMTYGVARRKSLRAGEVVTLAESVRGEPPQIRTWYPGGAKEGRHFIYPD